MRILKFSLGTLSNSPITRVYVGGRLKPMDVQVQGNSISVWVKAEKRLMEANEYTFYLVETGKEIPDGAKYVGTVQVLDGAYVLHCFMAYTTDEAKRSGDPKRDVGLQALDI